MPSKLSFVLIYVSILVPFTLAQNSPESQEGTTVPLTVAPGVPLRVYLTKRLPKRLNEPVHAKLLEPLAAFDREVVPAGADVLGRVSRLDPVPKWKRAMAIIGGDITPLHQAEVEFTQLLLPDGKQIQLHTVETIGLNTIYSPSRAKKKKPSKNPQQPANTGVLGIGKQQVKDQINARINGQTRGIADIVRGPDKKERLEELALMKLPYHPQWVHKGTRFDAVLREPLQFGTATFPSASLAMLGKQPPTDSLVHARLITPLDSGNAKLGQKVEAIVSQPLFSPDMKLILPEGTHLTGSVTFAHTARWFHRGGQLRFNFQSVSLPPGVARSETAASQPAEVKTFGKLESAEAGTAPIKVDEEGGVKATESKTRFIAPAISVLIAARSMDNDEGRISGTHESNVGGRTLGGASGFGLLGAAAAQSSRAVGSALGFYGMAWSVYTNIIARGAEVDFANNAAMDIRFGSRPPAAATKFKTDARTAPPAGGL